ncbi:MAG: hypothetical protein K0V04_22755 [Deltaproteobacteria bacterium]|nr:hypothetical protein [Deltaproteobacteria bacterium]
MKRLPLGLLALVSSLPACGDADPGAKAVADTTAGASTGPEPEPGNFGPEQTFELRLSEGEAAPLELSMTRAEAAELFGEQAGEVRLLSLDPSPLLAGTLDALRNACGTAWQLDDPDPHHDCSLTELGQQFGGGAMPWQLSPEYALVRLLTMTPANVDVTGTTTESLANLVDALASVGEIDPFSQVLADALGIERTQPVVSEASLVAALREHFVGTHPAVGESIELEVTLADALADLSPLAERYGPVGDHPGIIAGEVSGEIFSPDFRMRVVAESNLRIMDGVDASGDKGFVTLRDDQTGPTFEDELEFDFNDPSRFALSGIAEDLRVDMRVQLQEHVGFVPSCVGDPPCQQNLPGDPTSADSVWALPPWALEYVVTSAAQDDYARRQYFAIYVSGLALVLIGQEDDPGGWIEYQVEQGLGDPPGSQYLWETILEVAQVALHHTPFADFDEGDASVAFTVRDIPVGLSGAEAAEAVRPFLQEQAPLLSDLLLGNYRESNDPVDFYFRRAQDGRPYLFFVAQDDLPPGVEYGHPQPGFFADPDLTDKRSRTQIDGVPDDDHEKLALSVGETAVYFADDTGDTYRLRVVVSPDDDTQITVAVAPRLD